jgi:hypothetical protein
VIDLGVSLDPMTGDGGWLPPKGGGQDATTPPKICFSWLFRQPVTAGQAFWKA